MKTSAQHSVSVSAIITNDAGDVLLIQRRDNGHWEPPGGVLEADESIEHGLQREVFEETGLRITPGRLTGVYKNMNRQIVALVFRATTSNEGDEAVTSEAAAVAWVTPDSIHTLCDEAFAVRVDDALTGGQPAVRAHDGVNVFR